jgi:hypothetical protein
LFSDGADRLAPAGGFPGVRLSERIISRKISWLLAEFGARRPTRAGLPDAKGFQKITECFHGTGRVAECTGRAY